MNDEEWAETVFLTYPHFCHAFHSLIRSLVRSAEGPLAYTGRPAPDPTE